MAVSLALRQFLAQCVPARLRSNHFMRLQSSQSMIYIRALTCLLLLAWCGWAQAAIDVSIKKMAMSDVKLQDVRMQLRQSGNEPLKLTLTAASVDVSALGWHDVGLRFAGRAERGGDGIWTFKGDIALDGAPGKLLAKKSDIQLVM